MPPCSSAGARTSGPWTAGTISSRSPPLTSSRRSSGRQAGVDNTAPLRGHVLVGIERLLCGPLCRRYVAEVQAHPGPGAIPAAKRIDQDIRRLQMRARFGVPCLPALEAGEGVVSLTGTADLNERLGRGSTPRGCHARRLAGLLPVVRRPRRVTQTFSLLTRRELEQRFQRRGGRIDTGVAVA